MHIAQAFQLPLAIPFWIVFFVAFVLEGRVVGVALGSPDAVQDRGTFDALMIGSPLAMSAAIAASFVPWLIVPHERVALWFGIALLIGGAVLRRSCFAALGASFTGRVVVKKDQAVVQQGPYRYVRHPSYTAAFLLFLGVGFALGSWISVLLLFLIHCFLYGLRVRVEEAALLETLGEPYQRYMSRTKRYIPFVL